MNRRITLVRPSQLFDSFMDNFFNEGGTGLNTVFQGSVDLNMYETEKEVIVEVKAPGYNKDQIKITLEDNILTVEGTMELEKDDKGKKYHIKEISSESFTRSISLPTRVKSEEAGAEFKDGIMKISLPKAEEVKPKTINIKA